MSRAQRNTRKLITIWESLNYSTSHRVGGGRFLGGSSLGGQVLLGLHWIAAALLLWILAADSDNNLRRMFSLSGALIVCFAIVYSVMYYASEVLARRIGTEHSGLRLWHCWLHVVRLIAVIAIATAIAIIDPTLKNPALFLLFLPLIESSLIGPVSIWAFVLVGIAVAYIASCWPLTPSDFVPLLFLVVQGVTLRVFRNTHLIIKRGLENVQDVGSEILRARKVDDILRTIVVRAMELTHTDSGVIYLIDESGKIVTDRFCPQGDDEMHPPPRLDRKKGITRQVIEQKKIIEIDDISKDDDVNPILKRHYRSMIAIPMLNLGGVVIGVLYLNGSRKLTETECSFVTTLADLAALLLEKARLESLHRSIVEHIRVCVFRKDLDLKFVSANEQFCKELGCSVEEILGKDDFDFFPDNAEEYQKVDKRVIKTKKPDTRDEEHKKGDENVWVRVVKTPVLDSKGDVVGIDAIYWDVTKERTYEESHKRYPKLVEQSPDSIIVYKNEKIELANPAACKLFEVESEKELKGRHIIELIHEEDKGLVRKRMASMRRGITLESVDIKVLTKTDKTVHVQAYSSPIGDPESEPDGEFEVQVVLHDLTEVNSLLGEIHHRVGGISHSISLNLSTLEKRETSADALNTIRGLHGRVYAMSRIHTILYKNKGQREIGMEDYLGELVQEVFKAHGDPDNVSWQLECSDILLPQKYASACGLIVNELVTNSLRHAFPNEKAGRVEISLVRGDDGNLSLQVSDNGCGKDGASGHSGTSMGRAIVRRLVDGSLHGRMESSSSTDGVSVAISFPVANSDN